MRRAFIVLAVVVFTVAVFSFGAGEVLSHPAKRSVDLPPANLALESVTINGAISGWFSLGKPGFGAVLLLHGVRSDRRQMLERSKFLHAAGYSVLLIDLPAHGESDGERITFGYREAEGVRSALQFLNQTLPHERTAVIGVSLGAAALVLANCSPAPSAVVLESMYPTIDEAVADRLSLRLGTLGATLAPILLWQLPLQLGISSEQLRPIDHISSLHAPVLIVSGTEDRHTSVAETKRIFAAASEPKELWLVEGAAHVDLHAFNPQVYESRVSNFLLKHLQNAG
jgi:alpha-beta hydrolase superfamily lysophospholipase